MVLLFLGDCWSAACDSAVLFGRLAYADRGQACTYARVHALLCCSLCLAICSMSVVTRPAVAAVFAVFAVTTAVGACRPCFDLLHGGAVYQPQVQ